MANSKIPHQNPNSGEHRRQLAIAVNDAITDITAESILDLSDVPADPGADSLLLWDDSATATDWITEIPDSFLSANVPLLDASNRLTSSGATTTTAPIVLSAPSAPDILQEVTSAAADEKITLIHSNAGHWQVLSRTDADGVGKTLIDADRVGTTWSNLALAATSITANGSKVLTENSNIEAAAGLFISTDQTGVAVTAAGIHAALVNLGLITA